MSGFWHFWTMWQAWPRSRRPRSMTWPGRRPRPGAKAAGAVIDDAAVTPKYVTGFAPARELPIIWRIARGSLFNKLVILLPAGLRSAPSRRGRSRRC